MSNLKDQIEAAQRAVADWPADVKMAMGLEPTPSARVIELESKLDAAIKDRDAARDRARELERCYVNLETD